MAQERNVFISNKGALDYKDAERYGNLVFLSKGNLDPYGVSVLYRHLWEGLPGSPGLKDSGPDDYWLLSSLPILNCLGSAILAKLHSKINFLLYRDGEYIERAIYVALNSQATEEALKEEETA